MGRAFVISAAILASLARIVRRADEHWDLRMGR